MKRTFTLIFLILALTACGQTKAAPTSTLVPPTATATLEPSATNTPEPTLTPTPMPYLLEDGILYDLDEGTGEYIIVSEDIAELISEDGMLIAKDSWGGDQFVFNSENSVWSEKEKLNKFGLDPALINEVVVEAGGMEGIRRMWEELKASPENQGFIGFGESLSMPMMIVGLKEVSLEGRLGYSRGDSLKILYLYTSRAGEEYVTPVLLYTTKGDELVNVVGNLTRRTIDWGEYQENVQEKLSTIEQYERIYKETLTIGELLYPNIQTDWSEVGRTYYNNAIYADVRQLMPMGYENVMKKGSRLEILPLLEEIDDGCSAGGKLDTAIR